MKIFSREHDQAILRILHDKGREMTPDELRVTRKEAFRKVRERLREKGIVVPDDDAGLCMWLRERGIFNEP